MSKLDIKWEQGLIKEFSFANIRGFNLGNETADRRSFYNPVENSFGVQILKDNVYASNDGNERHREVEVSMAEGEWYLRTSTLVRDQYIKMSQRLTCLENSLFQDFVMRFCFSKESFDQAQIAGRVIRHVNSNVWHQYAVKEVVLENELVQLSVRLLGAETAGKFRQEMYVRDEPNHWIVHARMIPVEPYALYWIRWANRFFRLSLGARISSLLLMITPLKRMLWYLGERKGGKPNLQAQGLARLNKGEVLSFDVQVDVQSK
jgi:hypothetical protein